MTATAVIESEAATLMHPIQDGADSQEDQGESEVGADHADDGGKHVVVHHRDSRQP